MALIGFSIHSNHALVIVNKYIRWRIQDFLEVGKIFAENCMKMKEIGPTGGARDACIPSDPPMTMTSVYYYSKLDTNKIAFQ